MPLGRLTDSSSTSEIERLFRRESVRVLAGLIGRLGDFDLAEEALQDAFAVAVERWPKDGIPANPAGWITVTARNKAIDKVRGYAREGGSSVELESLPGAAGHVEADGREKPAVSPIADDRLRLIFTCCHPALAIESRVALTLRMLGGLKTPEIAAAFLVSPTTMGQRLSRAKAKIRAARIPYRVPRDADLPERLSSVLSTIYLIFNEGYAASAGDALVRSDLCAEAIRLGRVLVELMPDEAEALALLGLMLLHDSRRRSRVDASGNLVLLPDQDRGVWNRTKSRRAWPCSEGPGDVDRPDPTPFKRRSPQSTLAPRRLRTPTGRRSPSFTHCSEGSTPTRSSVSTVLSRLPWRGGPSLPWR